MPNPQKVVVTAPARLHMGFIDLSGALGRHFGSIGLALNEIYTRLTLTQGERPQINGPSSERAGRYLTQLCEAFKVPDRLNIEIEAAIPEHVGLGSGTQMALAIGTALSGFYGLELSVLDIAAVLDRGLRSGIGIGVFEHGGLVVDGGKGENTVIPPVLVHLDLPADWRFILVFDKREKGLHGQEEIAAFEALPAFPRQEAERFCYLLLMQCLPALAERDLIRFGEVITQLQEAVGRHFAPVQGGLYASREVSEAMRWLAGQGAVAVGQTSWGPTGFCMIETSATAEGLVREAKNRYKESRELEFLVASANNRGGVSKLYANSNEVC